MNPSHLGLGTLTKLVPNKSAIKTGLALGVGAGVGIVGLDLLQSKILVRNGAPMIPTQWSAAFSALAALVLGGVVQSKYKTIGTGLIAGGVGIGIAGLIAKYTSPAVAVTASAAASAEDQGAAAQGMAGFGFGRAFASGLGGLGQARIEDSSMLFGVGTPDMSASRMFNGATVAVEEGGPMSGASVAIETPSAFAGALQ